MLVPMMMSCMSEQVDNICNMEHEADRYHITVEVELPQFAAGSRSSFADEEINRISDLNIFVYHDGSLLEDYCCYFTDMSSLMIAFPYDKDCFNIYMVGNVGKIDAPEDESDVWRICHFVDSYDEFKVYGFPVANVFYDHYKGTRALFGLKRLVGQYNMTLSPSASEAQYIVKDVRLMNCALDVYPFGNKMKATRFAPSGGYGEDAGGDFLTDEDVEKLNDGEAVTLYFIENLQGELLPSNTDPGKKIPSSLEALESGLSSRCTYVEITADVITADARYTDGKYRFYMGQNETTDFSIRRNTMYDVSLDFTQNMVCEEEWRIDVDEPEVRPLILSKDVADVVRGVGDHILMEGPVMEINYKLSSEDDSSACGYYISDVVIDGKKYQKLNFYTEKAISGFYKWGVNHRDFAERINVVLESKERYNGTPLVTKVITAYVHDKAFPVFLRINPDDSGTSYQLEAMSDAPVNFKFEMSAKLTAELAGSGSVSVNIYNSSMSVMSETSDGFRCCSAGFSGLYNSIGTSNEKSVYFRKLDVSISGVADEMSDAEIFYMGTGGEAFWGPGDDMAPKKYFDLVSGDEMAVTFVHSCSLSGCVKYEIVSGGKPLFRMAPKSSTCSTICTTGTSNSLTFDIESFGSDNYLPFYIANGCLKYEYPVILKDESARYLDDSAQKSIVYQMYGPGRDVFYPNGAVWGSRSEQSPDPVHKFGYTAGLMQQFFGNIHTWQVYQDYESDFYMTVNGCTAWPGASEYNTGFRLAYNL